MLTVQIEIDAADLDKKLDKLLAATRNSKILDQAGAILLNRIRTRFLDEVAPDDVPWIPSKASQRRRARGGTGTLFDTGNLFRSIQLAPIDGEGDTAYIATDVEYGLYHQYGIGQVQRSFLGFNERDAALVAKLLALRISEEVNSP